MRELPGPTYALGFVRAYAEYLGLNGPAMARRFREETAGEVAPQTLRFPLPVSENRVPTGAMILLGALIVGTAYGAWYIDSLSGSHLVRMVSPVPERFVGDRSGGSRTSSGAAGGSGSNGISSVAQSGTAVSLREATPGGQVDISPPASTRDELGRALHATAAVEADRPTLSGRTAAIDAASDGFQRAPSTRHPRDPEAESTAAPPPAAAAGLLDSVRTGPDGSGTVARIIVRARADCWIEVKDDVSGKLIFARLLRSGESYAVPDRPGLKLLAGNAGGIDVLVDSAPTPALGRDGAVVRNVSLEPDRLRGTALPSRREG